MPARPQSGGRGARLPSAARQAVKNVQKEYTRKLGPAAGRQAARGARTAIRGSLSGDSTQAFHGQAMLGAVQRRAVKKRRKGK